MLDLGPSIFAKQTKEDLKDSNGLCKVKEKSISLDDSDIGYDVSNKKENRT